MSEYVDEDFIRPSPAQEFAGFSEFLPQSPDWAAEKISSAELLTRLSDAQRLELIGYLRTGLVRAFSSHAYVQFRLDEDKSFSKPQELLNWLSKWQHSNSGGEQAFHGCFQLPRTFWLHAHAKGTEWSGNFITPFCHGAFADWMIGKFGAIYDRVEPSDPTWSQPGAHLERMAVGQTVYFAVQFQRVDIEATFGKIENEVSRRASTYDWEAAFADVAAELYHHLEFADLHARGVQTELIELLRTSFENRRVAVPTDDTLKPKARKLLGALRSKKPEKPS